MPHPVYVTIWRHFEQECAFWGFVDISPHLDHQKPKKRREYRHFQAKIAKYKNVYIIETIASIPTKFCTTINTTNCASWWPKHAYNNETPKLHTVERKYVYIGLDYFWPYCKPEGPLFLAELVCLCVCLSVCLCLWPALLPFNVDRFWRNFVCWAQGPYSDLVWPQP